MKRTRKEMIESTQMFQATKAFLRPSRLKIMLFSVFMFISIAGYIQRYAFTDGEQSGIPKPIFYDILRPFPFGPMWMYLLLPLVIITSPLMLLGIHIPESAIFLPMSIVYLYVASFMVLSYEKNRSKFTRKYWMALIGLALGLNLINLLWAVIAKSIDIKVIGGLSEIFLVGIVTGTFVIIFYGYLLTCVAFIISNALGRLR